MPNPIIGRIVTSKRTPERPEPITPVPERYAGDNLPYRGIEQHGVSVDENWRDPADDMAVGPDGRLVDVYEHDAPEPDPIPVYIVNESSRERRSFRNVSGYAGGTNYGNARMILGQDSSRVQATIRCPEWGSPIYINDTPEQATAQFGFPLLPGDRYVTNSQEAVYASVPETEDQLVAIAVEYRVSLDG